ncbi:MAG: DUF4282 domain-containing protein [Nocardiaceae bacterium]|nr:DUF4282 domain-containing protein [Nocardiaceae bacterium]
MPPRHPLQETAHGLLDLGFRRHALPTVLPGIYLAGILPAVLIPTLLVVFAFRESILIGFAALLCLPIMIVAGMLVVRLLLELLRTIGQFAEMIARVMNLVFGFHDTMADVKGPARGIAAGIRAAKIRQDPQPVHKRKR